MKGNSKRFHVLLILFSYNDNMEKEIISYCNDKVIVVKNKDDLTTVPLFCHVCEFPMRTMEDSISFRKHGVCSQCDNRWTFTKGVSWVSGVLPNKNSEEWSEYISLRDISSKPIINFK